MEKIIRIRLYMKCPKCLERVFGTTINNTWQEFPTVCEKCDYPLMLEIEKDISGPVA